MPDPLFSGLHIAASAMGAERTRMTVASENLAHAGSTEPREDGLPYKRQRAVFSEVLDNYRRPSGFVDAEVIDNARYAQRYEPDHPHADPETGIVVESDIDPILELTDLMLAGKAYEANTNAVRSIMGMYDQALSLGER